MTKLEQAARQALEYLDNAAYRSLTDHGEAITALREALAEQTEQEPVAEVVFRNQTVGFGRTEERKDVMFLADVDVGTKLYAKSQQQAEQEPVVKIHKYNEFQTLGSLNLPIGTKLYAASVRTKDLTDDEIEKAVENIIFDENFDIKIARAVIAADREKNK